MDDREFDPSNYKLAVGQIWVAEDENDYSYEILGLTDTEVDIYTCETGDKFTEEIGGPDGFQDFLYWNGYTLKYS